MGKPHPIALRERVAAFVDEGMGTGRLRGISGCRRVS